MMNASAKLLSFSVLLLFSLLLQGQGFYRFSSDYTIKEVDTLNQEKISIGRLYLDETQKTLNFFQDFPTETSYKIKDSTLTVQTEDSSYSSSTLHSIYDQTIYHLIITSSLSDYGLTNKGFKIGHVKRIDSNLVVSEYIANNDDQLTNEIHLGKGSNGELLFMLVYDVEGNELLEVYFSDYDVVQGLKVPKTIKQIQHVDQKSVWRSIRLYNIEINEETHIDKYSAD